MNKKDSRPISSIADSFREIAKSITSFNDAHSKELKKLLPQYDEVLKNHYAYLGESRHPTINVPSLTSVTSSDEEVRNLMLLLYEVASREGVEILKSREVISQVEILFSHLRWKAKCDLERHQQKERDEYMKDMMDL